MTKTTFVKAGAIGLGCVLFAGCASWNRTGKGGAIGAGAGGVLGGIIGGRSGNTAAGILLGAALGGGAGAAIGHYMDKQAADMQRDLQNAKVERIGEGIKITFNSGILFDVNSASLKAAAQENLVRLAKTLNKYPDTGIVVQGYTDSTGSDLYNRQLSRERAESVAGDLKAQGVTTSRIATAGFGKDNPAASNATEAGRQANRRVEVAIFANDQLKKAAKEGRI